MDDDDIMTLLHGPARGVSTKRVTFSDDTMHQSNTSSSRDLEEKGGRTTAKLIMDKVLPSSASLLPISAINEYNMDDLLQLTSSAWKDGHDTLLLGSNVRIGSLKASEDQTYTPSAKLNDPVTKYTQQLR